MTAAFEQRLSEMFDTVKPSEVWICGHRFDVEFFDIKNLLEENFGEMCFETSTIKICSTLSDDMKRNVLLHEILHAIYQFAGLTDSSVEEDVVDRLATAQAAMFSDPRNAVLLEYLK